MNVFIGGRASGKTYQIIKFYKEHENCIIVVDTQAVRRQMLEQGVRPNDVVLLHDAGHQLRGRKGTVLVDINMDSLVRDAIGIDGEILRLGPVTINGAAKDAQGNTITPVFPNPHVSIEVSSQAESTGD